MDITYDDVGKEFAHVGGSKMDNDLDKVAVVDSSANEQIVFDVDEQSYEYKNIMSSDAAPSKDSFSHLYLTFDWQHAWDRGIIACKDNLLSHYSRSKFLHITPTLTCAQCCFKGIDKKQLIMVYDNEYIESICTSIEFIIASHCIAVIAASCCTFFCCHI
jgi:hypothetical protein